MTPREVRLRSQADVSIAADGVRLAGEMHTPIGASGIVAFAHGSGSSRHSPRNRLVARELQASGLATLLIALHACRSFVRYLSPQAPPRGAAGKAGP